MAGPTGTRDGLAGVDDFLAADQAFGGVHGDGAHGVFAQMLGHFEHQADFLAGLGVDVGGLQRVQDGGQFAVGIPRRRRRRSPG